MEAVVWRYLPSYCESEWLLIGNKGGISGSYYNGVQCHSTTKRGADHVDVGEGSDLAQLGLMSLKVVKGRRHYSRILRWT